MTVAVHYGVKVMRAVMEGPITEYGLADRVEMAASGSRMQRSRQWLQVMEAEGVIRRTGEMRPNPRGARKGTHPVYVLNLPQ